jgi:hypothetical protein
MTKAMKVIDASKPATLQPNNHRAIDDLEGEAFKITHPGEAYEGPHIGPRLAKKLDTHRWHVLRQDFDGPKPDTYEAVVASKAVTPNAIKKLVAKAWCARQIMWPNRQNGILLEVGGNGYYLVTPEAKFTPHP